MPSLADRLKAVLSRGRRKSPVAVDFDSRQLRIVQSQQVGGETQIAKLRSVAMPEGLDVGNAEALGQFLREVLGEMSLAGANVVMNVPRGQGVLKPLTLPPGTSSAELAGMVRFQTENELPFRPEEAVIDFTIGAHCGTPETPEEEPQGVDVLVGAVPVTVIEHYRQIAITADVTLGRLGFRPYANFCCVDACTKRGDQEVVALVHITSDETEIDVLSGGSLVFSRSAVVSVPLTGRETGGDAEQGAREVVAEVVRTLQSYHALESGMNIASLLVAGGTGVEPVVVKELARGLEVPCEVFDAGAALGLDHGEGGTSEFISAVGLALGRDIRGELPFDFLNPKRPEVVRNVKKQRLMAMGLAAVVAVLLAIGGGWAYLHAKESTVREINTELAKLKKKEEVVKALSDRVSAVKEWAEQRRHWLAHLASITGLFPPCKDAYITTLRTSRNTGTIARRGKKSREVGVIAVSIRARNREVIKQLNRNLTEAGYRFTTKRVATVEDPFGYIYSVDASITFDARMAVDVSQIKAPARPSDDDSAKALIERRSYRSSGSGRPSGSYSSSGSGRSSGSDRSSGSGKPSSSSRPSGSDRSSRFGRGSSERRR